ncbi:hypothetical protein CMI42_01375 [Candidatus Pacearchaeota archaeon]|nr:hypothetical protein [Candidatus Pacearchaeota archaeon]|tara:strand:+ start:567 stop:1553 length:987 start_codon:yes stop_codon:yes gene_type:complete
MEERIEGKIVDITPLFERAKIKTGKLTIIETDGMYPYKPKIEDNWAYFTAVGMKHLKTLFDKEGKKIESGGIVGICSGVEAIALKFIFKDDLKHMIVTDVDGDILKGTMHNLNNTVKDSKMKITPLVGSFCEPIEKNGSFVDFVHANIPNLPSTGEEDLTKGAEKGTFLDSSLYNKYNPPEKFIKWAMGAQYAYIKSARKVLKKGGSIITELGGRVPLDLVKELFTECGLRMEEVIVGFKEQTEALIDFRGYGRFEEEYGVSFEFYLYNESKELIEENKIENPSLVMKGDELKKLLEPHKVSSLKALELHRRGVAVGHTVHLFRGVKI